MFDLDIMYKVGASNRVVDALSWRDEDNELKGISRPLYEDITKSDDEV